MTWLQWDHPVWLSVKMRWILRLQSWLEKMSIKHYVFLLTRSQSMLRIMDPNARFPCVTFLLVLQTKCSPGRGSQNPFCNVFLTSLEKMQESAMLKILVLHSISHHLRKLSRLLPFGQVMLLSIWQISLLDHMDHCSDYVWRFLCSDYVWKFLCSGCRLFNEFQLQKTMGDVQGKAVPPLVIEPINLIAGRFYQCSAELRIHLAP